MRSMRCACACSNRSVVPSEANPAYTRRIISSIMSIPDLIGCSGLVLFLLVCNDIISLGCLIDLQSLDICQHIWKTHGKPTHRWFSRGGTHGFPQSFVWTWATFRCFELVQDDDWFPSNRFKEEIENNDFEHVRHLMTQKMLANLGKNKDVIPPSNGDVEPTESAFGSSFFGWIWPLSRYVFDTY